MSTARGSTTTAAPPRSPPRKPRPTPSSETTSSSAGVSRATPKLSLRSGGSLDRPLTDRVRAQLGPAFLAQVVNPQYQLARHLELLNRHLLDVAAKRTLRLIINIPVRHGKSELGSGYFPAYYLGSNPDDKVLLAGHNREYAQEYGQFARDVIELRGPDLYGVTVQRGSSSKTFWKIAGHRGRMISRGIGGGFPGTGADILIIDDPVRSPDEADSPAARLKLERWYTGIARSRLSPDGATVLIMSRWREDDFAGFLKALWTKNDLPFTEIDLPAIAMDNDPLGRERGEALWPDFAPVGWTADRLEKIRREVGPRTWNAQYQGVPTDAAGEFF
ncbi:MAG: hypothetical protein IAI49_01215, partial [Candidatus Eremiobacteraeota bacterium]|nr:hypothetical protein [Candidatus Eremiobacteraeota bacterium]